MKKQNKPPGRELNTMEARNLPDADFKILVIKMLAELKGRVDKLIENFNKEIGNIKTKLENIKMDQSEIKNTITEIHEEYIRGNH